MRYINRLFTYLLTYLLTPPPLPLKRTLTVIQTLTITITGRYSVRFLYEGFAAVEKGYRWNWPVVDGRSCDASIRRRVGWWQGDCDGAAMAMAGERRPGWSVESMLSASGHAVPPVTRSHDSSDAANQRAKRPASPHAPPATSVT